MGRLVMQESLRFLGSRRMIIVLLLCALAAYLSAGDLQRVTFMTPFEPGAWDVHAVALNSFMYIGYLVLVAFIVLVGDTLVADRESGFAELVLPRVGGRCRWWIGKLLAILLAALLVQIILLLMCLACGLLKGGWSLSLAPSAYATAGYAGLGQEADPTLQHLFAPVAPTANMGLRQLMRCLYETLAFGAIGVFLVALTVRVSKAVLPVAVALVGSVADHLLLHKWAAWEPWSPGRRLLESIHASWDTVQGTPWWTSLLYWVVLLVIGALLGGRMLRRADL